MDNPLQEAMLSTYRTDLLQALADLRANLARWQEEQTAHRWKLVRGWARYIGLIISEYSDFGLTTWTANLPNDQDTLVSAVIIFVSDDGGERGDEALRDAWERIAA
ncbi:MAG: hypothetical protein KGL39_26965 [Patescibacteria group bacterium]|nr:hypothetical protein [Patescibacteria group bacterium]